MLTLTTTPDIERPPAGTGIPTEGLTTKKSPFPMDTQQVSAPSRAPSAGVVHINIRLTDGYTIISNRLSQHRGMSLLAIGLGTHIQSLPDGRRVGVKALAAVFPESETHRRRVAGVGAARGSCAAPGSGWKLATRTSAARDACPRRADARSRARVGARRAGRAPTGGGQSLGSLFPAVEHAACDCAVIADEAALGRGKHGTAVLAQRPRPRGSATALQNRCFPSSSDVAVMVLLRGGCCAAYPSTARRRSGGWNRRERRVTPPRAPMS
ncbi:hypothetical protein SCYAM73S_06865 [Streptomyces cyaneofuscatus]